MRDKRYDEEMNCWIANQNPIFLLFWFISGVIATVLLFIPLDIYFFFKFKKWRR